ncbi:MAG TPA: glycosyltransferase [Flavobacteriales bacterium]|nr:glycosyltransferase [Flavobacteriales bacterium]HMR26625.1 glycosyltransferase [Flavobacteriales bacterium]
MHVLHIVGWYPNHLKPFETPFIERHVRALDPLCSNTVWQLDVRQGDRWSLHRRSLKADRTVILSTPLRRWLLLEWLATGLILWAWLTRDRRRHYDVVNFHIAYPNCARLGLLRRVMRRPMVITEHWSIYRLGFKSGAKGLGRIRRIFHLGVPLITVSRALADDILTFAGPPSPPVHLVANAVDLDVFAPPVAGAPHTSREPGRFFAIATWRYPKRPVVLVETIALLRKMGRDASLRIAGGGAELPAIEEAIARTGMRGHVTLIGQTTPEAAAEEMRRSHALLHASDYETFSAVCAEALCCGTPVVASHVGGIREYLTPALGLPVMENAPDAWAAAIDRDWDRLLALSPAVLSEAIRPLVDARLVAERYAAVLRSVAGERGTNTTPR